jgi:hypothetical protein
VRGSADGPVETRASLMVLRLRYANFSLKEDAGSSGARLTVGT